MLNYSVAELRIYKFLARSFDFRFIKTVICYLLFVIAIFCVLLKNAIFALFFTAPNIIPMILPQVQPNNCIALHLSALYSAIYDNLYF